MARSLLATFPDLGIHLDEVYYLGNDIEVCRVMLGWAGTGTHRGYSLYGKPTGRRVHIWGISQLASPAARSSKIGCCSTSSDVLTQLLKDDPAPLLG